MPFPAGPRKAGQSPAAAPGTIAPMRLAKKARKPALGVWFMARWYRSSPTAVNLLLAPRLQPGAREAFDRRAVSTALERHGKPLKRLMTYGCSLHRAEAAVLMKR